METETRTSPDVRRSASSIAFFIRSWSIFFKSFRRLNNHIGRPPYQEPEAPPPPERPPPPLNPPPPPPRPNPPPPPRRSENSSQRAREGWVIKRTRKNNPASPINDDLKDRDLRPAGSRSAGWRRLLLRLPGNCCQEARHGLPEGSIAFAALDARNQNVPDHSRGDRVRDDTLQPVANFDPDLAVFGQDEKNQAVIDALAADTPGLKGLGRPLFERLPSNCLVDINENLMAGRILVGLQPLVQLVSGLRRKEIGLVGHPPGGNGGNGRLGLDSGKNRE